MSDQAVVKQADWKPTKAGGWHCRSLPVRDGVPAAGIVRPGRDGRFSFVLFGRRGRMLCKWTSGYPDAAGAMSAAEERAARTDNR